MDRPTTSGIARPPTAHIQDDQHSPTPSALNYTTFPFPVSAADAPPPTPPAITIDQEERGRHPTPSTVKGITLLRARLRSHPKPFFILGGLILLMIVDVVGLVLYMMMVPGANEGFMTIINAIFVLAIVFIFAFMFRQLIIIHRLFHPPSQNQRASSGLPTWLTGLPTYRDVVREERRMGRSTDQEGWKGDLPAYGDTKGSELLLKSMSRDSSSTHTGRGTPASDVERCI